MNSHSTQRDEPKESLRNAIPAYSVVVPVYNSGPTLRNLHRRLVAAMEALGEPFESIFVDDGSSDQSWRALCDISEQDPRVVAVQLMVNSGQGNATLAGLTEARGEIIVTLDDDLQHPPEEIGALIRVLRDDDAVDAVMGVPLERQHGWFRRALSAIMNRLNSWLHAKDPGLRLTGFRAFRREVADALLAMHVPYPAIGPMLLSITRRVSNVTVRHDSRQGGHSSYDFGRMMKQSLSNFVGYSILPLRILGVIGAVGVVVALILGAFLAIRYVTVGNPVPGWFLPLILAVSSFNFLAFAIIGEYVLRICQISMRAPPYLIRKRLRDTTLDKISSVAPRR